MGNLQTKDLDCVMANYKPLSSNWFTSEMEKKFREELPVFPKFPKDKEYSVWKSQAERAEAEASLEEPYASQLKYVNFHGECSSCKAHLDGKIMVVSGMLVGNLIVGGEDA